MATRRVAAIGLVTAAALTPAVAADLPPGRYDAHLCVALGEATPNCGPADAEVLHGKRVLVRISDIVYVLSLSTGRIDVLLMHGDLRIDEFVAAYAWVGPALEFVDADKRTRYELRLAPAPRLSASARGPAATPTGDDGLG